MRWLGGGVAEASPLARRAALTQVDLAGLLEPHLRALEARIRGGRGESVREQLAAWEDALGEVVQIAPDRLVGLQRLPWFNAVIQRFRRDQAYRCDALAALNDAIVSGVATRVARWRWAGVAYGGALHDFIARAEDRAERDELTRVVLRDADAAHVGRYSVLNAALTRYKTVLNADPAEDVPRGLHAATLGLHLLAEARRHEQQFQADRSEYGSLMRMARSRLDEDSLAEVERIERTSARILYLTYLLQRHAERSVEARLGEMEERGRKEWSNLDRLLLQAHTAGI
jgi:hypothetical protein